MLDSWKSIKRLFRGTPEEDKMHTGVVRFTELIRQTDYIPVKVIKPEKNSHKNLFIYQ